jgi:LytS/YehU family sensor histidine kinase
MVVYLSGFIFDLSTPIRPPFEGMPSPYPPPFPPKRPIFFHFGQAIVSFLLIGFNTGVKSSVRWSEERVLQAEKERQHLHTELSFLKYQISPHFFMNTLNNIHALIDIDIDKAQDAIVKLSLLMRYLLYETDMQNVSLKKEIEFIESYIELMRLRYDEDILTVRTKYPPHTENIIVPSFLFLSFIENAFKHGVDMHTVSLINIRFVCENGRLEFTAGNSKLGVASAITDSSGIGLENVRKRLDLIYKEDYVLEIRSTNDTYEIYLSIPV